MNREKLNQQEIEAYLGDLPVALRIYETVDSTNTEAKRYALSGGAAPCAFLAETQTAGRGRMGRSFYSPDGTGIYLSLLFAEENGSTTVGVTCAAAVAVHRAVERICGIRTKIKWVNDLYYREKKVCGILAESFFVGETRYFVVGVGINLYTADFPAELTGIAGGLLSEKKGIRGRLAAETVRTLYELIRQGDRTDVMKDYRAHSMVLGREITYIENGIPHEGVAEAVDENGRLTVRLAEGDVAILASGEISLRVRTGKRTKEKAEK